MTGLAPSLDALAAGLATVAALWPSRQLDSSFGVAWVGLGFPSVWGVLHVAGAPASLEVACIGCLFADGALALALVAAPGAWMLRVRRAAP